VHLQGMTTMTNPTGGGDMGVVQGDQGGTHPPMDGGMTPKEASVIASLSDITWMDMCVCVCVDL